MYSLLEVEWAA